MGTPKVKRLKTSEIPALRKELLVKQQHLCPLCKGDLKAGQKNPALDHDHETGFIRDVLCINCNGMEGVVFNRARRANNKKEVLWLKELISYYERHETPQHGGILHPKHKTVEEKRIARNDKAKKKRLGKKSDRLK
jgi:hypothetical protein